MSRRTATRAATLVTMAAALAAPAIAGATERFVGATAANEIVSFTAQAPNRYLHTEPLEGMAAGETVVGMDQRPATGQVYALTSTGRLLVVIPSTGDIKVIGTIALTGTQFGFDFNPQVDRIRIVSNTGQNLRVHPDTAAVTVDGPLAYAPGDAGAGTAPNIAAAGYSLGVFGAAAPASTELYDIDTARDTLLEQNPPNNGTLVTNGPLGVDATDPIQFDVAGNQTAYAAFGSPSFTGQRLYSINLDTGAASISAGSPRVGTGAGVVAMTALGQVANDIVAPRVAIGNYTTYRTIWLRSGLKFTLSCPEDCVSTVTLRLGTTVLGTTNVTITKPGTAVALIKLTAAGRAAALATTTRTAASITISTSDAANNPRTQVARFISVP